MSDHMYPLPIDRLFQFIADELRNGSIFGIQKELFFIPEKNDKCTMQHFGQKIETSVGVAAGPHTQLAQNIITAWLCGARYIELKTVQKKDDIVVTKPCIDMEDEGYNCEWSQELSIEQSYEEYLKAWILIHVLRYEMVSWGDLDKEQLQKSGLLFNMSVGYDFDGIMSDKMQHFLRKMRDCSKEKKPLLKQLKKVYPAVSKVKIPDIISNNVTISTMHGCPPEEIEKIAEYFIDIEKIHTGVKFNPTLLGKERLEEILKNKLEYNIDVPEEAFVHDPVYDDAISMIKRLKKISEKSGVTFFVKLTNTLETVNLRKVLPAKERVHYMSGRALHPLAVQLAAQLQRDMNGSLDISFSGGADYFSINTLLDAGVSPVTFCSDLLKPGGYLRLLQIVDSIRNHVSGKTAPQEKLEAYASEVLTLPYYKKSFIPEKSIKTMRKLPVFDCIKAPCMETCAASQDVPGYMLHTANGDYFSAFETILKTNPFPTITGKICDHLCMEKCTRQNMDEPLRIRDIKRFVAQMYNDNQIKPLRDVEPKPKKRIKRVVSIIGAGPSGLACAWYCALEGFIVDVYESGSKAGGLISSVIPDFRITDEDIAKDIKRIENAGVQFHFNKHVDKSFFSDLNKRSDFIYIAVGASKEKRLPAPGIDSDKVYSALQFLGDVRSGNAPEIGKNVVVIGGGNSAMDATRVAWRLIGEAGSVTLIYRRRTEDMPADKEEIDAIIAEGVTVLEQTEAIAILDKKGAIELTCIKNSVGENDQSGRPKPIRIKDSDFTVNCDSIISAIGQSIDLKFLGNDFGIRCEDGETTFPNVFIGGDALRGPKSIVSAIADGLNAAHKMTCHYQQPYKNNTPVKPVAYNTLTEFQKKLSQRTFGIHPDELALDKRHNFEQVISVLDEKSAQKEAARCLSCNEICNICVSVCPNRALFSYEVKPVSYHMQKAWCENDLVTIGEDMPFTITQGYQVAQIADFCNECGNCETFCPTDGAPYKDKPRFTLSEEIFEQETNIYLLGRANGVEFIKYKEKESVASLSIEQNSFFYHNERVNARLHGEDFRIIDINYACDGNIVYFQKAAQMSVLLRFLKDSPLLCRL